MNRPALWLGWMAVFLCAIFKADAANLQTIPGHVPAAVRTLASTGSLSATKKLHLAFGLPLRNRDALTNLLQQLYDPASPQFHQFLTADQFTAQFGPTAQDCQALSNYLSARGLTVTETHSNRILIDCTGAAADVEKLLRVRLRVYQHPDEPRSFFAPDAEPSLDSPVPVAHISGLDDFAPPKPMSLHLRPAIGSKQPAIGSGPGGAYFGNDFRAAYVPGTALTGTGQAVGLVEFDGYFASDVTAYRQLAALPNVPLKNILLDDFNGAPGGNNDEVALDIDMATSIAPGLAAILVYEGNVPDDILSRIATDNLAKQISASWLYPVDPVTEQIFLQFAAQGQSFFNAAGDSDAYPGAVSTPADDPNITSVGGTTLQTTGPGGAWLSETVWNWGSGTGTGGGFSTTYPIPSWQQPVSMASNQGSTNFRNLPDVALTADNVFVLYDDGVGGIFGGTSCATPLWAGFVALVNQQAAANGKPPQGFINPAVYAIGLGPKYLSAFHDIITGNNTGPSSPSAYFAAAGFDLCTGWGTPNGTNLINLLAPLDDLRILPASGFNASGAAGGPFSGGSQIFVFTNAGTAALNWSAGGGASWLAASPGSGTLLPGGPAALVTVSLTAAATNQVLGSYSASLRFTNLADGFAQSRAFMLNILTPPVITLAPKSEEALGGETVQLTTQATGGAPLSYQWRQNGTNLADGGIISGSSTTALTLAGVGASNGGSYTVVVSNAAGAVTSSPPAVLTITPSGPFIVTQPASQYALVGATATLNVFCEGTAPLSYQWQQNGSNLVDSGSVSGSGTSALMLSNVSAAVAGTYTVVISNIYNVVTSKPAVFSVYAKADTELLQNGGFETGDFSFWNATGNSSFDTVSGGVLYTHSGLYGAEMGAIGSPGFISQTVPTTVGGAYLLSLWLDSPDGEGPNEFEVLWNGNIVIDSTNLPAIGWTNFQVALTATVSSTTLQLGFEDDASFLGLDDVSLKPLDSPGGAPIVTTQPPGQVYAAAGGTASISVSAAGLAPLSYQWRSNSAPIPGATNATLTLSNLTLNQGGIFSAVVSNSLGTATSSNATLTVLPGNPESITFDDLGVTNAPVPNGYAGLQWSNFYHLDSAISAPNPSGYIAGTISSPSIAFNQYGTAAAVTNGLPFDFLSARFTAAWDDNLRLEAKGYTSNGLAYDQAYFLSSTMPQLVQFNYVGVTNVQFITSGGTPNPIYGGSGFEFVMDNASVVVNTPPPPPNDQCAGAIVINADPFTNTESTLGANTNGDPVPSCLTGLANAVWYQFTAPGNGYLVIDTSASDYNASVALYTGACGALAQYACGVNSTFLPAGQSVYIIVGAIGNVSGKLVFRSTFTTSNSGPPYVVSSPTNTSAPAGQQATFSVGVYGQAPLNYSWERNGVPIPGATASAFTLANPQITDSGAQFSCVASNALGTAASAAATLFVTPPGELVQNGGFESGDFSYWTESGNFTDTYVNNFLVHSGRYGVSLGAVGTPAYLSQVLATSPGQVYRVSLWLDSPDGLTNNAFSVTWNATPLFNAVNLGRIGWTNLLFSVPGTTASTLLQIGFRDDPAFLGLDDVSVQPERPTLQNVSLANSVITFQWSALPLDIYQIQGANNLAVPVWTNIGSAITATNYIMSASQPVTAASPQFYRILLLP
jgi:hypothetical protein